MKASGSERTAARPPDETAPADPAKSSRAEIAREKTSRTRARLLDATLVVWAADDDSTESTVIRDVAAAAGVSRATFYKHFSSLDEAAAALGNRLSDEMVVELGPIQDPAVDPLMRASLGIQLFLWRAFHDPTWGKFVSRSHHVVVEPSAFMRHVEIDLSNGIKAGEFEIGRIDVALTLNNGALKEGMSALSGGVREPNEFIEMLAEMILRAFGVDAGPAVTAVKEGSARLKAIAPGLYDWWRRE